MQRTQFQRQTIPMTSVVIIVHSTRVNLKASPMSTVPTLIEQCLKQAGLADVAAADCQLIFNKRPLDKSTPFRLLNVPAAAKLELITGCRPRPPATPTFPSAPLFLPTPCARPRTLHAVLSQARRTDCGHRRDRHRAAPRTAL